MKSVQTFIKQLAAQRLENIEHSKYAKEERQDLANDEERMAMELAIQREAAYIKGLLDGIAISATISLEENRSNDQKK